MRKAYKRLFNIGLLGFCFITLTLCLTMTFAFFTSTSIFNANVTLGTLGIDIKVGSTTYTSDGKYGAVAFNSNTAIPGAVCTEDIYIVPTVEANGGAYIRVKLRVEQLAGENVIFSYEDYNIVADTWLYNQSTGYWYYAKGSDGKLADSPQPYTTSEVIPFSTGIRLPAEITSQDTKFSLILSAEITQASYGGMEEWNESSVNLFNGGMTYLTYDSTSGVYTRTLTKDTSGNFTQFYSESNFIELDGSKTYEISADVQVSTGDSNIGYTTADNTTETPVKLRMGILEFDAERDISITSGTSANKIEPANVSFVPNSLTRLTSDLISGQTTINVESTAGFKTNGSRVQSGSNRVARNKIWIWNWECGGISYPAETISKNSLDFASYNGNTITLSAAYSGETIPAGTEISQRTDEGAYANYCLLSTETVDTVGKTDSSDGTWVTKTTTISGYNSTGIYNKQKFCHGMKYIRFIVYLASAIYSPSVDNVEVRVKNITIKEVDVWTKNEFIVDGDLKSAHTIKGTASTAWKKIEDSTSYTGSAFTITRNANSSLEHALGDYIEVDTTKTYNISLDINVDVDNYNYYIGLVEYDAAYEFIYSYNVVSRSGSNMKLTADLVDGATTIQVDDSRKMLSTGINGIIIWDYTVGGKTYAKNTYSRNTYGGTTSDPLIDFVATKTLQDAGDYNTLVLNQPWSGGTHNKNTYLSQYYTSDYYNYSLLKKQTISGTTTQSSSGWKTLSGTIGGTQTSTTSTAFHTQFRRGTKFVKLLIYRPSVSGDTTPITIKLSNIRFSQVGGTSTSANLFVNGDGIFGDNTNFSGLTYTTDNTSPTGSSFNYSNKGNVTRTEYYGNYAPVDINSNYVLSTYAKDTLGTNTYYLGMIEYDIDKKQVEAENVLWVAGSTTKLARDINNGDTVIYLENVSNFEQSDVSYRKGFIFWNYKDSTGYQYPVETYSRNIVKSTSTDTMPLFDSEDIDTTNNCIYLNYAWKGGTYSAGTDVSQCTAGGTFAYTLLANKTMSTSWTLYSNTISGINENQTLGGKFRHGTKYVRLLMIRNANANNTGEVVTSFTNISLVKVS